MSSDKSTCLRQYFKEAEAAPDLLICNSPHLIRNLTGLVGSTRRARAQEILADPVLTLNSRLQLVFEDSEAEFLALLGDRFYKTCLRGPPRLFRIEVQILDIALLGNSHCH